MGHEARTTLRALTVRQPWAFAITHGKPIENRRWKNPPSYRGPLAIHAGAAIDTVDRDCGEYAIRRVAELSSLPVVRTVCEGANVRRAVVAVAQLADVCSAAFAGGDERPPRCGCGPWAVGQQRHLILADVWVLSRPVPCLKGALGLWYLPDDVDAEVRVQLREAQPIAQPN